LELISLAAAITLTEWSERTLRRKLAEGSVSRALENGNNGKTLIHFDSIKPHICILLHPEDLPILVKADEGDVEAQTEMALLFLSNDKPKGAIDWLQLAARQDYAEAMHWLGRCHIEGNGVPRNENLGMMWLSKAAAHGHAISQGQMQAMRDKFTGKQ
jgi:TPR repeat protein